MELEQLKNAFKSKNKKEVINILSYKYFGDFLDIKDNYNKSFSNSLLADISNFKKKFKLFLIGLFDILDLKVYLIHKSLKNRKKDFLDILFKLDHINALKVKKRYLQMYGKSLENEFKENDAFIYIKYLLSDYFFPNAKKKDLSKIVDQLIKINESGKIDLNFISYCFQLPNDILFSIIKLYEEKKKESILNFIENKMKLNLQEILKMRISFIYDSDLSILANLENAIKNNNSWMLTKIIILNKNNWHDIKEKYIKKYGKLDLSILNENTFELYKNIIEFNHYDITMGNIFLHIKIYSINLLYILNVDKVSLKKYINSYTKKETADYSEWCNRIEKDLYDFDDFFYSIIKKKIKSYDFSFNFTKSIAFIIKVIFSYYKNMIDYNDLLEEEIDEKSIASHNKILKEISKYWSSKNFNEFYLFFPFEIKNQIYMMRYYIIEITFLFCEKDKLAQFKNNLYYSLKNDSGRSSFFNDLLPFEACDFTIITKFHKSILSCKKFEHLLNRKEEEKLDPGWKITKVSKFCITFNNKTINYKN